MVYLISLFILLIYGLTLMFIFKNHRASSPIAFIEQEQFINVEPVLHNLPRNAIKNSHWFTHTFMRPRRKG